MTPVLAEAYAHESDEALAVRARRDRKAFTELYHRYLDHVYRYMRYQAPTEEAQDLTAQVFMHAYRAAEQFRNDGASYRSWLFRIAHNALASWRRGRQRVPLPVPDLPEIADASTPDMAESAASAETARALWSVVSELPASDRELVALRYVEDLPPREIARIVGGSDGALRVRLHRLHRKLRRRLEAEAL